VSRGVEYPSTSVTNAGKYSATQLTSVLCILQFNSRAIQLMFAKAFTVRKTFILLIFCFVPHVVGQLYITAEAIEHFSFFRTKTS
jgi:hypothetical protein